MTTEELAVILTAVQATAEINRKENREDHQQMFAEIGSLKNAISGMDGGKIAKLEERVDSLRDSRSEGIGAWKLLAIACTVAGGVAAVISIALQ